MHGESMVTDHAEDITEQELLNRLPELQYLHGNLYEETVEAFLQYCPEYFWEVPASSSGNYHPWDHCRRHGLWLHTKRAFTAYMRMERSYREQGLISSEEGEYGRAAILLHDLFKQGLPPRDRRHTQSDHDVVAARFLERKTELPEDVISCVRTHNGPNGWGAGPAPDTDLEQLHHQADMTASGEGAFFAVLTPHETLRNQFDHLDTVNGFDA